MKKIFKCLGLFCLSLAVAIGSFFVTKKESKAMIASADSSSSIYTFVGSNIYTPIKRGSDSDSIVDLLLVGFRLDFDNVDSNITINFEDTTGYWFLNLVSGGYNYASFNFNSYVLDDIAYSTIFNGAKSLYVVQVPYSSWQGSSYFDLAVEGSSNVPSEIIGVSLGYVISAHSSFDYQSNFISYFDASGNYIKFYFHTRSIGSAPYAFETRTYYFNDALDLDNNQIYQKGFQQGLADNQQNIYNSGYNAGKIIGYNNGKTDGIASANNYTFIGLISAVFDAPLQTFKGLLNFNVLGINLLQFAFSLFTIAVTIFIIRIINGGK